MAVDYPKSHDEWVEWTRRWWESMLSIPKDSNPINDKTGENFKNFNQPADGEDVWFLAGNVGGTDIRKITVKKGKALFFPEVNYIGCKDAGYGLTMVANTELVGVDDSLYFSNAQKDEEIQDDARKDIDEAEKSTKVDYEGAVKQKIRKRVPMSFMKTYFANPPVMGRRYGTASCLFDGFWVFTEPLDEVGKSATITIQSNSFSSKVVYNIDIVS